MKKKLGFSALQMLTAVFSFIGLTFLLVAGMVKFSLKDEDLQIFVGMFLEIGALCLLMGLLFRWLSGTKSRREKRAVARGEFVMGEITAIRNDYSAGASHSLVFQVRYEEPDGTEHLFLSHPVRMERDDGLMGTQVKVYVDRGNFRRYSVDLSSIH